jgi:ectoine hydroxylase-related dioxygenase (phytanoyl-CoA dioxygenase family)
MAEPWHATWALNVIWCLDDVHEANGATRYLPGSHRFTRQADVPADALARTRAFAAEAGSIVAMGGRLWHTSGENVTRNEERALMFGFYSADFLRPQSNWNASLSPSTIARLSPRMHERLGLGAQGNARQAARILRLPERRV